MADSLHELLLNEGPEGEREAPADGATDSIGMRELIESSGASVEDAARGMVTSVPMDVGRQLLNDAESALMGMGYAVETTDGADTQWSEALRDATRQFQDDHELPTHGSLDADTYQAIMEAYEQALETQSRGADEDDFNPVPGSRFSESN